MKRITMMLALTALLVVALSLSAFSASAKEELPDGCVYSGNGKGQVTCSTSPGNNQAGVGQDSTTNGNLSNCNGSADGTTSNPRNAQGGPFKGTCS